MKVSTILLLIFILYCISQILSIQKKTKGNKQIMNVLNNFKDKEEFEKALNAEFKPENTNEYNARLQALRVWGGAYHDDEEMFDQGLKNMDIRALFTQDVKGSNIGLNESTFFWLLLFAPNNLYSKGKMDWADRIYEKVDEVKDGLENEMIYQIAMANKAYYKKEGDLGKATYMKIIDGDYEDLHYTKDMISLYKSIVAVMMGRIALDEGKKEEFEEYDGVIRNFAQIPLGERWLSELGIVLEDKKEETEVEEVEETKEEEKEEVN